MRKIAILVVLAGLALAASACGERAEPTGPAVKLFPVSVSPQGGGAVTLEHAPRRVAVITSAAASVVIALESGAQGGPKILVSTKVTDTRLQRFDPDVVITSSEPGPTPVARATKAPVYTIDEGSIRQVEESIVDVGALLGRPLQARQMVAQIESKRREVQHKIENLPRVSVFVDTGFYISVAKNSLAGDIVSEAGGRSIAGTDPGPVPFDLGLVARRNPDFYLATSGSGVTLKDLRKNPRTRHLRAVRAGHFGIVPTANLQPGPTIGDGLEAVARLLHPNAFR